MEEKKKKKLIKATIFYLILGNIIIPLIGYLYTGTIKGALTFYGWTFVCKHRYGKQAQNK